MSVPKVRISLDEPTGDFWVDNGIIALYEMLGEGDHNLNDALSKVNSKLVERRGNIGYYYDIEEETLKNYELENWIYPTNYFIKVVPQTDKIKFKWDDCRKSGDYIICEGMRKSTKDKLSIKISLKDVEEIKKNYDKKGVVELFLEPPRRKIEVKVGKKKGICAICGAEDYLVKGKQWMYPFLVDSNKFGNFYSQSKGSVDLCPRCVLAGLAGYLKWIYVVGGKDYMHIFMFHSDLRTLSDLYEGILNPIFLESSGNRGRNFPLKFFGNYVHETTMGLILSLFEKLKTREGVDEDIAKMFNDFIEKSQGELRLFAVSGKPGNAFNMNSLVEFSQFSALYRLYNLWLDSVKDIFEDANPLVIIPNVFSQFTFQIGKKRETLIRDRICWKVLTFEDPLPYIEKYLYDPKGRRLRVGTLQIFEIYVREVLKMEERHIRMLAAIGHEIGRVSAEKGSMDVLYSLRNAKNLDEFLKVLNDINFKLGLTVNEELLRIEGDRILEVPWIRVKTLLSIYAMNEYLRNKRGNRGDEK
ncbi:hypothetical protein ABOONEI_1370 [Aciduliprofundum boonei T469]|nr:hypothetical protein ABOONEI_1370 [Aciduliprofundum boonei T469]